MIGLGSDKKEEKKKKKVMESMQARKRYTYVKKDILMIYLCWWKQICKEFMAAQAGLCGRAKAR